MEKMTFWKNVRQGCAFGLSYGVGMLLLLGFLTLVGVLPADDLVQITPVLFVVPVLFLLLIGPLGSIENHEPVKLGLVRSVCSSVLYAAILFGGLWITLPYAVGM